MEKRFLFGLLVIALIGGVGCGDDENGTDSGVDSGTDSGTDAGGDAGQAGVYNFRTDALSAYTQVDRIGMPAVSTALITSKDDYNDDTPADDVMMVGSPAAPKWAGEIISGLRFFHDGLQEELAAANLGTCADTGVSPTNVDQCVAQATGAQDLDTGPGVARASVIPDVLTIDATAAPGFPNGRMLADPVMDVTLAVILLDLAPGNNACGSPAADCTVGSLVGVLNPATHDTAFNGTFPFVLDANTP